MIERLVDPADWCSAAAALHAAGARYLDMLTAAERPDGSLEVVAHIVAMRDDPPTIERHLLATVLAAGEWRIDSVAGMFPGAAWHEREVAEMFGVTVDGALDTRPLLLTEPTMPLRKDVLLDARMHTPWPGREEGSRRRPLGVPEEHA